MKISNFSKEAKERENLDPDGASSFCSRQLSSLTTSKITCKSGPWLRNGGYKLPFDESISESPNGSVHEIGVNGTEEMTISEPRPGGISSTDFILGCSSDNMLMSCKLVENKTEATLGYCAAQERRLSSVSSEGYSSHHCSQSKESTMTEIGNLLPEQRVVSNDATGHFVAETSTIKRIIESNEPYDTVISCSDGRIGAHRAILFAASPLLGEIFQDHTRTGDTAVIVLPDISKKVMEIILTMCYTGEIVFPKELNDEIFDAMKLLMVGMGQDEYTFPFSMHEVTVKVPSPSVIPVPSAISHAVDGQTGLINVAPETNIPTSVLTSATTEQESSESDTSDSSDDDDKSKDKPFVPLPGAGVIIGEGKFGCGECGLIINKKDTFIRHLKREHATSLQTQSVPFDDLMKLSYCSFCNVQYKTFSKAKLCYTSHQYSRCMTCLGVFPSDKFVQHYKEAHAIKTKHGKATKCRWCNLLIPISENAKAPIRHAESHIPSTNISKGKPKLQNPDPLSEKKVSESIKISKASNSPLVLPSLKRSENNLNHVSVPVLKKRKLDDNGNPIQVAKRSYGPPGTRKPRSNVVLPSMRFKFGTYSIQPDPVAGTLVNFEISKLPKVYVHLKVMSYAEINSYVEKRYKQIASSENGCTSSKSEAQSVFDDENDNEKGSTSSTESVANGKNPHHGDDHVGGSNSSINISSLKEQLKATNNQIEKMNQKDKEASTSIDYKDDPETQLVVVPMSSPAISDVETQLMDYSNNEVGDQLDEHPISVCNGKCGYNQQ